MSTDPRYSLVPDSASDLDLEQLARLGNVVTAAGVELPDDLVDLASQKASELVFNDQHRGDLFDLFTCSGVNYDPQHDRFRLWDGTAWPEDSSREHVLTQARIRHAADLIHQLIGNAFELSPNDTPPEKERKSAGKKALSAWRSRSGRGNVLGEAKILRAVSFDLYDLDPEELNTPDGLLNLRTGKLTAHHPGMLVTRTTAARYVPGAESEGFADLIGAAMPDPEIRAFVQECFGASLTGVTAMRAVFVLYGPRGTRKSTLTRLFRESLGSYADVLPETAVSASNAERAINEGLAGIIGRRAVFCDELTDGFRPNLAQIKRLTGSDVVKIEQKFKPAIAYRSSAKLWFTTNHPFYVPAGEDAAWERFYVVPFEANAIPEEKADKLFAERMVRDPLAMAAVLAWGIEGARRVLERGGAIVAPASVTSKREEVRQDANPLSELIEAGWLLRNAESRAATADVRDVLERWADRRGLRREKLPNDRKLGGLLRALGCNPAGEVKDRRGAWRQGWQGVGIDWDEVSPPARGAIP